MLHLMRADSKRSVAGIRTVHTELLVMREDQIGGDAKKSATVAAIRPSV